jgi:hypothetical protein
MVTLAGCLNFVTSLRQRRRRRLAATKSDAAACLAACRAIHSERGDVEAPAAVEPDLSPTESSSSASSVGHLRSGYPSPTGHLSPTRGASRRASCDGSEVYLKQHLVDSESVMMVHKVLSPIK